MLWSNFLHIYQPYNQQLDILERIVNESYRRLLAGFKENKKAKLTLNINGGLVELLLKNGYDDVVDDIKLLAERGQLELTASAMYHPFLPLLPEKEIKRQIDLNNQTNQKYFGKVYQPRGFFSPELAYSHKLSKIIEDLGYQWIVVEELASGQKPDFQKIYSIKHNPKLKIIFRDKKISVLILSAIIKSNESFLEELGNEIKKDRYLLTVMDGETFGHHRPGLEKFLFEIYNKVSFKNVLVSELVNKFSNKETIEPRECTWSSEEQDFWLTKEKETVQAHPFLLWQDPLNPIHQLQWEFTYFVIDLVKHIVQGSPDYLKARESLDKSLQSDQFWWASAKPWWSLEMIEQGAYQLKKVVALVPNLSEENKNKTEKYYHQILDIAFNWQRKGKIRQAYREALDTVNKKPFKERVSKEWYNLIILEFEDEMKKATKKLEFEKAIKWRDALEKLKQGLDIYDVLHVVDDLRASRTLPSLKGFWEHSLDEFSGLARESFKEFEPEKFSQEQFKNLLDKIKQAIAQKEEKSHPLGFFRDKYDNFYLCEFPGPEVKFHLKGGWDSFSQIDFSSPSRSVSGGKKEKEISYLGQLIYRLEKNKLKVVLKPDSLLAKVYDYLKKRDKLNGQYLKIALLSQTLGWAPQFFQKDKTGQLNVEIPYLAEQTFFKFKIIGFQAQTKDSDRCKSLKGKVIRSLFARFLGQLDYLIQKLIGNLKG